MTEEYIYNLTLYQKLKEKSKILLCSGGARGSDIIFSQIAVSKGIPTVSFIFNDHKITNHGYSLILNQIELDRARKFVDSICTLLKRAPLDKLKSYIQNLLLRDCWTAFEVNSIYAIGTKNKNGPSLGILGGTAYACEIFASRCIQNGFLPLYFFDQNERKWYQAYRNKDLLWKEIVFPPKPHSIFAGIGTREINQDGINEIHKLFDS